MLNVDKSVESESYGKNQNDFLNWLQGKLEDEMKKDTYQNYYKNEHTKRKRIPRR
mgnify:CR=1 FL=1